MDRSRIEVYAEGGKVLVDAYRDLQPAELFAVPVPGTWTLQQIAVHLYDSDVIGSDRLKRIASMDRPLLIGYDETAFNALPGIAEIDAMQVCQMFKAQREITATILRRLPDSAFQRWGIHNEIGRVSLAEMVDKYIAHLDGHLKHIYQKRALLGKPL